MADKHGKRPTRAVAASLSRDMGDFVIIGMRQAGRAFGGQVNANRTADIQRAGQRGDTTVTAYR